MIEKGIELAPGTIEQVNDFKKKNNYKNLPKSYVDFLLAMGNGTSDFLQGESCFFNELPNLQKWGKELLDEDNSHLKLSQKNLVFFMSQGCMFAFFNLDEGDNPPVYLYRELSQQEDFKKITNSFTEFLFRYEAGDEFLFKI
ncbi:SMI1/KNR4 family protein [Fulvivirga sediminis]|uniref:SMI1/KNR4 family protein n=1 Tax=Fulvivirga sediminis TaxID=2803949 RepID=A0A937K0W4_9BACT|nr:SMI1/KNR4 family protein [Fulvivirga sediminis]MBL3656022.1 SMI1/KNR4 family protein [Fulvivirga sediminis]